jgi:membrane protease YdiL (CAAX protease family)
MSTNDTYVKKHGVALYFLLTLLISWLALLLIMGLDPMLGRTQVNPALMPLLILGMVLGPTIAGLVMTGLVYGRAGYRDLLARVRDWRAGAGWYVLALLAAPVLVAVALLLLTSFSPGYIPDILTSPDKPGIVIGGIIAGIIVGIFEELGWTGFAIPRLRLSHGVVATGLILGLVWGLWHMPLFVASALASRILPPALVLAVQLFTFLPAFRVFMVWVYERTHSLPLAILLHVGQTATTFILAISATEVETVVSDLVYTVFLCVCIVVVLAVGRRGQPVPVPG